MNSENDKSELRDLAEICGEAEYVDTLLDAEKQLVQAARLLERILKTYFIRDGEGKGLGTLVSRRREDLSTAEFDSACFAVDIRNRTSHHTAQGEPSPEEMKRAASVFLQLVRRHASIAERRLVDAGQESEGNPPVSPHSSDTGKTSSSAETSEEIRQDLRRYAAEIPESDLPDLSVSDESLRLSASTLAEHTFCRRAGLLTHEGDGRDPGAELPSLGLMSWYEPERLNEAYAKACNRWFGMALGLPVIAAAFTLSPLRGNSLWVAGFICVLGYWVYLFTISFSDWIVLSRQRIDYQHAEHCEPDATSTSQQRVDWWGLLQSGFEVEKPAAPIEDEAWKLIGKPRRLLLKDDYVIPVHRIRKREGPIESQHIVRAMALCHLVNVSMGAESPYAIILFANTNKGVAVSYKSEANRDLLYESIRDTRTTIMESDGRVSEPLAPMPTKPCQGCPHGRPRSESEQTPTMYYGEKLDPNFLIDRNRRLWHSCCGDRFGGKADHVRARHMKLVDSDAT